MGVVSIVMYLMYSRDHRSRFFIRAPLKGKDDTLNTKCLFSGDKTHCGVTDDRGYTGYGFCWDCRTLRLRQFLPNGEVFVFVF